MYWINCNDNCCNVTCNWETNGQLLYFVNLEPFVFIFCYFKFLCAIFLFCIFLDVVYEFVRAVPILLNRQTMVECRCRTQYLYLLFVPFVSMIAMASRIGLQFGLWFPRSSQLSLNHFMVHLMCDFVFGFDFYICLVDGF